MSHILIKVLGLKVLLSVESIDSVIENKESGGSLIHTSKSEPNGIDCETSVEEIYRQLGQINE